MKTGRKGSTDTASRRKALKERLRYQAKSKAQREAVVDNRDRGAQQAADARRHERDKPTRLAKQRAQNQKERDEDRPQLRARAKAYLKHGPPSAKTCSSCGAKAAGYHHSDYNKAEEVTPLCASCHGKKHRAR